ncbi:FAR1-related sequence 5-like protein [Tanacetum coccineum]|uniref:Protein FAR1-RELATED SEQUENCE n=1 Tax=Tanacetum coccineum TaxID=301880 RepID=A0ABQ5G012_9ASTR
MRTTSRSESENSFWKSFKSPGSTLVNFMMSYEAAMERQQYRQEALDFKTLNAGPKCETKLTIEHHAARVYTRTIFLLVQKEIIEGAYRTLNTKTRKEQDMESLKVAESVLNKDEVKLVDFLEKLKLIKDEVKADVSNPSLRNTGDVIGGIFSISKPKHVDIQNPTKARNRGTLKEGERRKNEREKALKVREKQMKVCGHFGEKTNEHNKTTCPQNPKARKKGRRH